MDSAEDCIAFHTSFVLWPAFYALAGARASIAANELLTAFN